MQVGIPVAYSVCEVKPDNINHWICVYRGDFELRLCIKIQVKSRTIIGCANFYFMSQFM